MIKIARFTYLIAAWLFVVGVVTQVFLAGMVVVASRMGWNNHVGLGHFLSAPLLVMLISQNLGRMPGRMKRLTWLQFSVYVLQADVIIFLRAQAPLVSAFHPVLALIDFALGVALVRQAWALARQPSVTAGDQADLDPSTLGGLSSTDLGTER